MEPKKEDRRVRLTRQAIRESLIELMQTRPISKISVKMVCEAANINRSTFYAHYRDQYALLAAVQQEIICDLKERIFSAQFFSASDGALPVLVQLLEYGKANAPLIRVLLSENGDSSFQNELMQLAQEKIMEELSGSRALAPHTMQYLKYFVLGGLLNIMRYWLESDCADPPETVAGLMIQLVVHGTSGLLPAE